MFNAIVFCGGKCGGMSLAKTLHAHRYQVTHLHGLRTPGLYKPNRLNENQDIVNIINKTPKNIKITIIDSYRTPIERKISSFFQNISKDVPDYANKSVSELITIFNDKYLHQLENYHPINQMLDTFDLPHFTSFDFNKKYNKLVHGNLEFIKIRFNDIDNWGNILTDIFGRPIKIFPDNMTKNKKHVSALYEQFKKEYRLPRDYIDKIKSDSEFLIYNSQQEQNNYIAKWNKVN
jgi:hypothetical protein